MNKATDKNVKINKLAKCIVWPCSISSLESSMYQDNVVPNPTIWRALVSFPPVQSRQFCYFFQKSKKWSKGSTAGSQKNYLWNFIILNFPHPITYSTI